MHHRRGFTFSLLFAMVLGGCVDGASDPSGPVAPEVVPQRAWANSCDETLSADQCQRVMLAIYKMRMFSTDQSCRDNAEQLRVENEADNIVFLGNWGYGWTDFYWGHPTIELGWLAFDDEKQLIITLWHEEWHHDRRYHDHPGLGEWGDETAEQMAEYCYSTINETF